MSSKESAADRLNKAWGLRGNSEVPLVSGKAPHPKPKEPGMWVYWEDRNYLGRGKGMRSKGKPNGTN